MGQSVNEYRVKVTVRNNLLLSAIEAAGYGGWGGLRRFCDAAGIESSASLTSLLSMRTAPINQDGEFCQVAKQVMECLGAAPSDLWTDRQLMLKLKSNTSESTVSESAVEFLLDEHNRMMTLPSPEDELAEKDVKWAIERVVSSLPRIEAQIITDRFVNEKTLDEIAQANGLSTPRIRQIEQKALRRLREPKVTDSLKQFVSD